MPIASVPSFCTWVGGASASAMTVNSSIWDPRTTRARATTVVPGRAVAAPPRRCDAGRVRGATLPSSRSRTTSVILTSRNFRSDPLPRSPRPMANQTADQHAIIYTHTDEAPLLATYSFLPIVQAYAGQAGVPVETRDISLAGRILAQFPERLTDEQRSTTRSPSSASWPKARGQHHQAAQHLGLDAAAKGRDQRAPGAGSSCPTIPTRRGPTRTRTRGDATTRSRAVRSTRSCARGTPTGARPCRSSSTPASTRTRWARGRPTRRRTSPP